jgi:hypothetical protein
MSSNEPGRAVKLGWRRPSSCASGQCAEVAHRDDMIILRDSKQPHHGILRYIAEEWRPFVRNIKAGELDGPRSFLDEAETRV